MPVRTDSSLYARPRVWLAWAALSLGVGCGQLGGCLAPPTNTTAAPGPESVHPEPDAPAPRKVVVVAPPGPTPMLTDEARAARLHAQRIALGERAALLEDAAGQPFPSLERLHDASALGGLAGPDPAMQPLPPAPSVVGPGLGEPVVAAGNLDALPGSQSAVAAVNGNMLGNFILLDGSGATGLTRFHEALRQLKRGEDADGKVRVLMYGASHTAADVYPSYLRAYLQKRFGDGGLGFVPLVRPSKSFRPLGFTFEASRGWKIEHAQKSESREDGFFGLFGASAATSKKRDYGRVIPVAKAKDVAGHKTRYELYYLSQPGGGKFKVSVDGEVVATISTRAGKGKPASPAYHALTREGGPHTVEIKPVGDGEVRVFGMTVENADNGVVVDTLGIGGTRAANQLKWDEHVWADNLRRRAPDLVVLAYGSNESVDEDQPMSVYRENLREVLARLRRASPEVSCLLVGPGDFPTKLAEGTFGPRPRTVAIVATQREVAGEFGCAFWDMMQFMGGEQSMLTWAAAQPAMASSDHLHLTRRGYTRMGMAIADALMFDFDAAGVPGPMPVHPGTELATKEPVSPVPEDSKTEPAAPPAVPGASPAEPTVRPASLQ